MASKKEKRNYFILLNKLKIISASIFQKSFHDEDQSSFALCLVEIYSDAQRIIKFIDDISNIDVKSSKTNYDKYVTDLVDMEIWMYDEMRDWMKQLRKPLQKAIGEITYRRNKSCKKKKDCRTKNGRKTISHKNANCR